MYIDSTMLHGTGVFMNEHEMKSYILEEISGKRWHLRLSCEKHISYSYVQDGAWTKPADIDNQRVKDFAVTIDAGNKIHLLAYTISRQLLYYTFEGNEWKGVILEKITSRFHDISYLDVFSSCSHTHILYYISNSLRKATEHLVHFVSDGKGWEGGKVWNFVSDSSAVILSGFVDENAVLYLLYGNQFKNDSQLHICIFSPQTLKWSSPVNIHKGYSKYKDARIFIDRNTSDVKNIHIVWKEEKKQENLVVSFSVNYLRYNETSTPEDYSKSHRILFDGESEPKLPVLTKSKTLNCLWLLSNNICCAESSDNGDTWSGFREFPQTQNKNCFFYFLTSPANSLKPPTEVFWGSEASMLSISTVKTSIETKQASPPEPDRIKQLEGKLDEVVSLVNEMQERIKDNNKHQMETLLKRLSIEFDDIQRRRAKSYKGKPGTKRPNPNIVTHTKNEQPETSDEKITLGKTKILVNPEEEEP